MGTSTENNARARRSFVPTTALAKSVIFDDESMQVLLTDGRVLSVPLVWFPVLQAATPEQRARFEIGGGGINLHWEEIDEDLSVPDSWPAAINAPCNRPFDRPATVDHPISTRRLTAGFGPRNRGRASPEQSGACLNSRRFPADRRFQNPSRARSSRGIWRLIGMRSGRRLPLWLSAAADRAACRCQE